MRKLFFNIMMAVTTLMFTACSSSDDGITDGGGGSDNGGGVETFALAGTSWYNFDFKEEDRYATNRKFYTSFANFDRAAYTEGTYSLDGNKLTWNYTFQGQNLQQDWILTNIDEVSYKIVSDDNASHVYYKITEEVNMQPGDTVSISQSDLVSPDERMVTISGNKLVAKDVKGKLFIQKADKSVMKVVIGTEVHDLWYDYTPLVGMTIAEAKEWAGVPSQTTDDYLLYTSMGTTSDYISEVIAWHDGKNITELQIILEDGVNDEDIVKYLDSKYYVQSQVSSDHKLYLTNRDGMEGCVLAYYKNTNKIVFIKIPFSMPEYKSYFGGTMTLFKRISSRIGEQVSEGKDSLEYSVKNSQGIDRGVFYFRGEGKKMNSFGCHVKDSYTDNDVLKYLKENSELDYGEKTMNGYNSHLFYTDNYNVCILYIPALRRIEVYDLSQKDDAGYTLELYTKMLGKQKEDYIKECGDANSDNGKYLLYQTNNDSFPLFAAYYDATGKVNKVRCMVASSSSVSEINSILSSNYRLYKKDTENFLTQYINSETVGTSTMSIIYNEEGGFVDFQGIN